MRGFLILLAAVLVAIGIGVGAESAALPAANGPAGVRFIAAWPGNVTRSRLNDALVYSASGRAGRLSVWVLPNRHAFTGWIGYAPLSRIGPVLPQVPARRRAMVDGQTVRVGIACTRQTCAGTLLGLTHRTGRHFDGLMATAEATTAGQVRALLSSLRLVND